MGIPSLGSFAYGEFIYQTEDGRSYAYVQSIGHPAWERIQSIFDALDLRVSDQDHRARIFQRVMIRCADPLAGKSFTTRFPLCSRCGEKIRSYSTEEPLFDEEIPEATWKDFLSATEAEQKTRVLDLIDQMGAVGR